MTFLGLIITKLCPKNTSTSTKICSRGWLLTIIPCTSNILPKRYWNGMIWIWFLRCTLGLCWRSRGMGLGCLRIWRTFRRCRSGMNWQIILPSTVFLGLSAWGKRRMLWILMWRLWINYLRLGWRMTRHTWKYFDFLGIFCLNILSIYLNCAMSEKEKSTVWLWIHKYKVFIFIFNSILLSS